MIKIYAVDDDDSFLDILPAFTKLSQNLELVGTYSSVATKEGVYELVEEVEFRKPDVILMDINFHLKDRPQDFGIYLTSEIKKRCPNQKIIMLAKDTENDKKQMTILKRSFSAGAVAYLSKGDLDAWSEGIQETMRGDTYVSSRIREALLRITIQANDFNLTFRELEAIYLLSEDKKIAEVAKNMKSYHKKDVEEHLTFDGANYHIKNAKLKLGVKTNQGLVAKALRNGLIS